jgi:hypothetical protein
MTKKLIGMSEKTGWKLIYIRTQGWQRQLSPWMTKPAGQSQET